MGFAPIARHLVAVRQKAPEPSSVSQVRVEIYASLSHGALSFRSELNLDGIIGLQLSALLADVGLNIREAHVFSTVDGYSLDVFVVDGWPTEVPLSFIPP